MAARSTAPANRRSDESLPLPAATLVSRLARTVARLSSWLPRLLRLGLVSLLSLPHSLRTSRARVTRVLARDESGPFGSDGERGVGRRRGEEEKVRFQQRNVLPRLSTATAMYCKRYAPHKASAMSLGDGRGRKASWPSQLRVEDAFDPGWMALVGRVGCAYAGPRSARMSGGARQMERERSGRAPSAC
ncbi:hypothetical protein AAT19DRAFT_12454 [Rhodotorula toruloides]|uniref:Uncharacterized protein n=1 Tax=Rhodotorula toruloides TaxID=5286 RepID=A0A2T0AGA5_RHOTO|nr:hypothetical protein AAT19DRAFT_12454 [Rhodotorula toruloides]